MRLGNKEVITIKTVYIANDGTEFYNEVDCRDYEKTARGVINARQLWRIPSNLRTLYWLL